MDRFMRTHCMVSTFARFESSRFLTVGTPKHPWYAAPVDDEEVLHNQIVDTCQTKHSYPGIIERMWWSMVRCVEACLHLMEDILST
jgi:hypothetical protein